MPPCTMPGAPLSSADGVSRPSTSCGPIWWKASASPRRVALAASEAGAGVVPPANQGVFGGRRERIGHGRKDRCVASPGSRRGRHRLEAGITGRVQMIGHHHHVNALLPLLVLAQSTEGIDEVVADETTGMEWATAALAMVIAVGAGWFVRCLLSSRATAGDEADATHVVVRANQWLFVLVGLVVALAILDVRITPLLGVIGIGGIAGAGSRSNPRSRTSLPAWCCSAAATARRRGGFDR